MLVDGRGQVRSVLHPAVHRRIADAVYTHDRLLRERWRADRSALRVREAAESTH
jgi:hypothetical protein